MGWWSCGRISVVWRTYGAPKAPGRLRPGVATAASIAAMIRLSLSGIGMRAKVRRGSELFCKANMADQQLNVTGRPFYYRNMPKTPGGPRGTSQGGSNQRRMLCRSLDVPSITTIGTGDSSPMGNKSLARFVTHTYIQQHRHDHRVYCTVLYLVAAGFVGAG